MSMDGNAPQTDLQIQCNSKQKSTRHFLGGAGGQVLINSMILKSIWKYKRPELLKVEEFPHLISRFTTGWGKSRFIVVSTWNREFILVIFIIILFFIWTTVSLLCPNLYLATGIKNVGNWQRYGDTGLWNKIACPEIDPL